MNVRTNTMLKVIPIFLILISSILLPFNTVLASNDDDALGEELRDTIEDIINWKKKSIGLKNDDTLFNNKFLQNAGDTSVDWYPIGIGRVGYEDDYESYLAVINDVVEKRYEERHKLGKAKSTEWHRISLAILAAGGNPREVGTDQAGKSIDLIADGTYNRGETRSLGAQGLNGWIWGLIALDSLRYKVPEDAHETRKDIIENILSSQLKDGGFALMLSDNQDIDITAMALQALAPYYNSEETYTYNQLVLDQEVTKTVRQVVDEALDSLSEAQLSDGEFASWDTPNVESTVQVIVALTSLGIDPLTDERFIKDGNNLLDVLLNYRMDDGGFVHSFTYDEENASSLPNESNSLATEQVLYGLVSMLRHAEGYRTLYDFREEIDSELKEEIDTLNDSIEMLSDNVTEKEENVVEELFKDYLQIPVSERLYVYNYKKLANAMKDLEISNTSEAMTEHIGEFESGDGVITPIFNNEVPEQKDMKFTVNDNNKVGNLPKDITTEYEVEVVKLMERLQQAVNKDEYEHLEVVLNEKKQEIEEIKQEIEKLNSNIMQQLYPFENIKIKDKENVEDIMNRYEQLSDYDQEKIESYDDVEKSYVQIESLIRARYIAVGVAVTVVILSFIVIYRFRKRKKEKEMMI